MIVQRIQKNMNLAGFYLKIQHPPCDPFSLTGPFQRLSSKNFLFYFSKDQEF